MYSSILATLLALGLTVFFVSSSSPPCLNPTDPCQCKTSAGLIDLRPLDNTKGQVAKDPRWKSVPSTRNPTVDFFSYNPCSAFSLGLCYRVAVCQMQKGGERNVYIDVGDQFSAVWSPRGDDYQITYKAGLKTTQVLLKCGYEGEGDKFTALGETGKSTQVYELVVESKHACINGKAKVKPRGGSGGGISPGSILLIIFFSLLLVYLLGGMAYNRASKGATGIELLPNISLWRNVPGDIKKIKGLKRDQSYERH